MSVEPFGIRFPIPGWNTGASSPTAQFTSVASPPREKALPPAAPAAAAPAGGKTIKLGVRTALSGSVAKPGNEVLNSGQLAVDEWNAKGGAGGMKIEVLSVDDASNPGQSATVSEKLFGPFSNPVGQTVRIRNIPFQVVAVAGRKGQTPTGQDSDDVVFIPRTSFQAKIQGGLGKFLQGTIFISATNASAAERQVAELLRDRHRIGGARERRPIR